MNEVLVKIHAEKRLKTGTGNSREFRSNKMIPGIIYGEKKEPIPISLNEKELKLQLNDTGFFSKQCEITLDNENFKVLPKDVQLHPVKENILHIDFLRVGENTNVTLFVPVKFINENKCEGMVNIRNFPKGYFLYNESSYSFEDEQQKLIFQLGDSVFIEVINADIIKRHIDFKLIGHS